MAWDRDGDGPHRALPGGRNHLSPAPVHAPVSPKVFLARLSDLAQPFLLHFPWKRAKGKYGRMWHNKQGSIASLL